MLNKVQLIGRLGQDIEVLRFENGNSIAKTSLATSENYKDKSGEWQEQTTWHNLVFWGRTVDYVESRLKKGMLIFVEGKIEYRTYEDKNGIKRTSTNIKVSTIRILERQDSNEYSKQAEPEAAPLKEPVTEETGDDLPF